MANVPTITTIQKTECIGNSLVSLTTNFDNIKNSISDIITQDLATLNNTITELTTRVSGLSSSVQLAKAWVLFNGTNGNIQDQYNVSSVNKDDTGIYTVTFQTPLNDIFSVSGLASPRDVSQTGYTGAETNIVGLYPGNPFPGNSGEQCKIVVVDTTGSFNTPQLVSLVFFSR